MTKKRKKSRRETDALKDEVLETAKKVVEQALPLVGEGVNKIFTRLTKSLEEKIKNGITKKLNGKKSKRGEKTNVNPQ